MHIKGSFPLPAATADLAVQFGNFFQHCQYQSDGCIRNGIRIGIRVVGNQNAVFPGGSQVSAVKSGTNVTLDDSDCGSGF